MPLFIRYQQKRLQANCSFMQPLDFRDLYGLHYIKVGHILVRQLKVFGHMDIFLVNHHSFLEKEFIGGNPILLRHQHHGGRRVREGGWKGGGMCGAVSPQGLLFLVFTTCLIHSFSLSFGRLYLLGIITEFYLLHSVVSCNLTDFS